MPTTANALAASLTDVGRSLGAWRIWWMLARNDIAGRYRRSRVGPFWLTISMGVMVIGLGVIYAALFKMNVVDYLPSLALGLIFWTFFAASINESATLFGESQWLLKQTDLPKFTYTLRVILRNLLILAHNTIIIVAVMAYFRIPLSWSMVYLPLGLVIVTLNLAWVGYVLSIVGARFRDVPLIVQSVMQLAFFVTPVVFRPDQLGRDHLAIWLNPFAWMLDVVRGPILGTVPSTGDLLLLLAMAILGWAFALVFAGRYGQRIVYWL